MTREQKLEAALRKATESLANSYCMGYGWTGCTGKHKQPRSMRTCHACWGYYNAARACKRLGVRYSGGSR